MFALYNGILNSGPKSRHSTKSSTKIIIIVVIQLSLVVASYGLLQYYTNNERPFSDLVNHAGKNRYLAEKTLFETVSSANGVKVDPLNSLTDLEQNVNILRYGGTISGDNLPSLPDNLLPLWEQLNQNFIIFKGSVLTIHNTVSQYDTINQASFEMLYQSSDKMVLSSDSFVKAISDYSKAVSDYVVVLRFGLLATNVGGHVLAIFLIVHILRKEAIKTQKLDKLAVIGETTARLGHDLRNPLSVIKLNIEMLQLKSVEGRPENISKERFDTIDTAILRISHQIEDVLDFVRIRPLELGSHSLHQMINSVMKRIQVPEHVKIEIPQNDIIMTCDIQRLEVVLINLVTNAIQAIKNNGTVKIKIFDDSDNIQILVEDSGIGIPRDIMPKIFEPLFTTKQTGTGLGLPSCKNIVEQHGGHITVKNYPTTFTVTIPKIKKSIKVKEKESLLHDVIPAS